MDLRKWWIGSILDLLLLVPALYMAAAATDLARRNSDSLFALAVAVLFLVLPLFCIAAPLAARRALRRGHATVHAATLFAAPWIYAIFLVIFLSMPDTRIKNCRNPPEPIAASAWAHWITPNGTWAHGHPVARPLLVEARAVPGAATACTNARKSL